MSPGSPSGPLTSNWDARRSAGINWFDGTLPDAWARKEDTLEAAYEGSNDDGGDGERTEGDIIGDDCWGGGEGGPSPDTRALGLRDQTDEDDKKGRRRGCNTLRLRGGGTRLCKARQGMEAKEDAVCCAAVVSDKGTRGGMESADVARASNWDP